MSQCVKCPYITESSQYMAFWRDSKSYRAVVLCDDSPCPPPAAVSLARDCVGLLSVLTHLYITNMWMNTTCSLCPNFLWIHKSLELCVLHECDGLNQMLWVPKWRQWAAGRNKTTLGHESQRVLGRKWRGGWETEMDRYAMQSEVGYLFSVF